LPNSALALSGHEAYAKLAYLAARTTRIRLGTMVTAATFRAPSLVVKTVTTLDVLSGGRAWLGLGVGYQPHPPVLIGGTGRKRTLRLVAERTLASRTWSPSSAGRPFTLRDIATLGEVANQLR
jgi:alkanesulfonate monooxygenase SsuD/methylene tetrahydromethanopterin reductase-like flavin-dependent oxidoreductase (luciferase family)